MIIIKNRLSGFLLGDKFAGMALYPFVLINPKSETTDKLLRHERIHLQQQKEVLVLPFFLWYLFEYALGVIVYKDEDKAYRNISFEREAYANEDDESYLSKRKFWAWLKY